MSSLIANRAGGLKWIFLLLLCVFLPGHRIHVAWWMRVVALWVATGDGEGKGVVNKVHGPYETLSVYAKQRVNTGTLSTNYC